MRKIICVMGQPATGKSTIMKKFLEADQWITQTGVSLVPYLFNTNQNLAVLGSYPDGEPYGGTDRMSMACQPEVEKWVDRNPTVNLLFEGDRLANQSFLEYLSESRNTELKIFFIDVDKEIIAKRHEDRKDTQNEKFLKGRITKYENLRSNFVLMPFIKVYKNNTEENLINVVSALKEELYNRSE